MDVRGIEQKQVFREKNLSLNSVHGRTLFNRLFQKAYGKWYFRTATEGGGSTQKRRFCAAKTRVQKCTRMYTSGQAISKGLRKGSLFLQLLTGDKFNPIIPLRF